jgi:dTDP-4-dehydrorhamnose 3,5-epimerase
VIQYKCDNLYRPSHERGIALNDPSLGIDWKTDTGKAIISEKDLKNPHFRDAENNF